MSEIIIQTTWPTSGDSYADAFGPTLNSSRSIPAIQNTLLNRIAEIQNVLSAASLDLAEMYHRRSEWVESTGITKDREKRKYCIERLSDITQFSESYVRDLIKIGTMLVQRDKTNLLETQSKLVLRAIAYKKDDQQDFLLKKVDEEGWGVKEIQSYDIGDYHRNSYVDIGDFKIKETKNSISIHGPITQIKDELKKLLAEKSYVSTNLPK